MLVAKKEVSKIDVLNKKPLIRKSQTTGEMIAGFLDPQTGEFEVAMEIADERDIDEFLERYDLSVVMISKMFPELYCFFVPCKEIVSALTGTLLCDKTFFRKLF